MSDDTSAPKTAGDEQLATAYHEAGHAVAALSLGRSIEKLTITRNSIRLGAVHLGKGRIGRKQDFYESEALILLGGLVCEARLTGKYNWGGAQQDLSSLRRLSLARVETHQEAERLERRLLDKATHFFDLPGHWEAVESIATELSSKLSISGRAARHFFDRALKEAS